jgi:two-component system sensor histidine kinase/response regulator
MSANQLKPHQIISSVMNASQSADQINSIKGVQRGLHLAVVPWLLLALMLALTFVLWNNARHEALHARKAEFEFRIKDVAGRLYHRMHDYEHLLYGVRAFFLNLHQVEHREFHGYIAALKLQQRFQNVQAVDYVPLVSRAQKKIHERTVRRDGLTGYAIRPLGDRGEYAPISYVEPLNKNNLLQLGFDNLTDPERKAALERSRDLGQAVITGMLQTARTGEVSNKPLVQMFLPLYRPGLASNTQATRRSHLTGWLAVSFYVPDMMSGVLGAKKDDLDIEIYDGTTASEQHLMYDSDNHASRKLKHLYQASILVPVAGRDWLFTAHSLPGFETGVDMIKPALVAVAGTLTSILFAMLVWLLLRDRARTTQLAAGLKDELRERKKFQEALQENEQRWKLALESAGHGVWDCNVQTGEVEYSDLYLHMLGYSREEYPVQVEGRMRLIHPDDRQRFLAAHNAHLEGMTTAFISEHRILCKDGNWKWIISRGMVVERDERGRPLRMIGTHTDLSERRQMESALRLSEAKLHATLDNAPIGIWLIGVDGRFHFVNKTLCDSLGIAEHAFLGAERLSDVMAPEIAAAWFKSDRECLVEDALHVSYETLVFADGKQHLMEIRKMPFRDDAGETVGVVGIGMDVTEQRAREEALRESEENYRELFEFANEFITTTDLDGNVTSVNNLMLEILGYSYEEMLGMNLSGFMTPESLAKARRMTAKKLAGESKVTRYELDLRAKDGRAIPAEFSTRLLYKDGKPVGIHAIGHDISERKKYERALRESEERYHSIFDNAQDFVFTIDTSSRLTSITNYFYQVTGYAPAEVINAQIGKILTPESLRTAERMIAEKVEKGLSVTRYEVEVLAKDGHLIPIELNTSLSYKNGKLVGSVGIGRDITERRAYERALLESEEKYRGLFENAGDFAYSTDLEGNFSAVSESLLRATGYGRTELLSSSITMILSKANLDLARKMTAAKLAGEKETTRYEMSIIAKDGAEIPIEVVSALVYRDGKPVGVQGIGRDISERKRVEEALRHSESNYRELMEQAADAIMVADHDAGRYVDVNRAACKLLGYTRKELLELGPRDLLDPEELKVQPAKFDEIRRGETTFSERHLLRKDGSRVLVEMSAKMLPDGRMMSVKRDITERHEREEALRQSEQKWRELMEQATEAIMIYDQNMRCVDLNRAAQEMFGFSREELLGQGMRDLVHPDDMVRLAQPEEQAKLKLMLEGKITIQGERRMRRKDGSYIPVQISAKRLSGGRILSIKRDVSEWLERETALRDANIKAEAASRAKSEFLANMSHEIRTPMNSVIGMARLALLHEHDSGQRGYLEKILLSGEHLLGIIDDILDFSKIDAGRLGIEHVDLDIARVMENVSSIVSEKAKAKGLHFMVDVGPDIPGGLSGDPLRLRQVLLNFTDNAIKFTAKGEVTVSVRKLSEDQSDCLLHFEVHDTGIGMSDKVLSGLFRSFQQADGSVTRNYGGTGLGLVISRRLVELMGGKVGVSSEPGKGSTFWFQLPLHKGAAKSSGEIDMVDEDSARERLVGKRILLVENNLFNQQVARELMENVGMVVLVANNGEEALDLLRQESFDSVLMDLQMPVMDGLEAVTHIRANPDWDALPVVAMTANVLEEERNRCLDAGMNDFIAKPVRPEMLYAVLVRWLSPGKLPGTTDSGKAVVPERKEPEDLVDFSVLEELMGGKQDKVRELALKFSQSTRADQEKLDNALEQQDAAQVRALGHHIKSPAAMIGAMGLADLCRALENIGDDLGGAHGLMRQLWEQLAAIEAQIEKKFR